MSKSAQLRASQQMKYQVIRCHFTPQLCQALPDNRLTTTTAPPAALRSLKVRWRGAACAETSHRMAVWHQWAQPLLMLQRCHAAWAAQKSSLPLPGRCLACMRCRVCRTWHLAHARLSCSGSWAVCCGVLLLEPLTDVLWRTIHCPISSIPIYLMRPHPHLFHFYFYF